MSAPETSEAPVKPGDILAAKYRIEEVIGVGGMGVVVSAMQIEPELRVAVKFLLKQAAANDELVGRFVREAKASAKLKGTHVTKVLDVGQMDDGRAYIVMEFLEGSDLSAALKSDTQQFAISDAVSWVLQACEGLAEAHALGIIHRDLKPGNLFLTKPPGDGKPFVKVLDFGISKSINPTSSDFASLTKTEMMLGSPLYMAPEQMRSSKYVDERSDIWALGAIAYELLCRHVPFEADTLLDLCFKVAQETCRPVHERRPEIPAELSAIVMRCLEKDADARFSDIAELAAALEPFANEAENGSAKRIAAVLAGGSHAPRPRRSASVKAASQVPPDQTVSVNGATERAGPSDAATSTDASKSEPPKVEGTKSAPPPSLAGATEEEPPPPSSAWGTTQAQARPHESHSTRNLIAGGVVVAAIAVLAFFLARANPSTPPPPVQAAPIVSATASATAPEPSAAPSAEPEPSTAVSVSAAPTATPPPAPAPTPSAKPKPKPTASATAAPTASEGGDFFKVRE